MKTTGTVGKTRNRVTDIQDTAIIVVKNLERLVEAVALLVVAGFAVFACYHYQLNTWGKYTLLVAAAVIAVRGAIEFLRHLAQKPYNK